MRLSVQARSTLPRAKRLRLRPCFRPSAPTRRIWLQVKIPRRSPCWWPSAPAHPISPRPTSRQPTGQRRSSPTTRAPSPRGRSTGSYQPRDIGIERVEPPDHPEEAAGNRRADKAEEGCDLGDREPEGRQHDIDRGEDRVLDRAGSALAHQLSAALRLLAPCQRFLLLALALEPPFVPQPIGLSGGALYFEPTLVVAQILFGRDEDLARPDHGLLDDGDGRLERSGFPPISASFSRGGQARFGLTMRRRSAKARIQASPICHTQHEDADSKDTERPGPGLSRSQSARRLPSVLVASEARALKAALFRQWEQDNARKTKQDARPPTLPLRATLTAKPAVGLSFYMV